MDTIRVRFVGGPWHNQLRDVEPIGRIRVVERDAPLTSWDKALLAILGYGPEAKTSTYTLCRFVTLSGCDFLQYVHETRFYLGKPDAWTCNESFPRCRLDIAELERLADRGRLHIRGVGKVEQESP